MNGRALNEKAIEVSPSSNRVLDRAADILTPFPPSKNRPRPGDWTCPSCGFSNFQRRTACFRCSFPAVSAPPDPMYGYGYGGGHPGMMGHPVHHHMGHHGHGMGGGGGMGRGGGDGSRVPFRAGDWKCGSDGCGYHNFAKNVSCLRCGASRASAAVVADPAYANSMDGPGNYGMGPPSMAGTPGPSHYGGGGAGGYGSAGGFPGQGFGGPPSTYALPSGLGAAASSPYPPMGSGYGGHSGGMHSGGMHSGGFDSRAEAAFSSAGGHNNNNSSGFSNGSGMYGGDGTPDPFNFLSSGLHNLSMSDDARRNGANSSSKSPA